MCKWRDFFIMVRKGEDPWRKQHEIRERETSTSDIKKKRNGVKRRHVIQYFKKEKPSKSWAGFFLF